MAVNERQTPPAVSVHVEDNKLCQPEKSFTEKQQAAWKVLDDMNAGAEFPDTLDAGMAAWELDGSGMCMAHYAAVLLPGSYLIFL